MKRKQDRYGLLLVSSVFLLAALLLSVAVMAQKKKAKITLFRGKVASVSNVKDGGMWITSGGNLLYCKKELLFDHPFGSLVVKKGRSTRGYVCRKTRLYFSNK